MTSQADLTDRYGAPSPRRRAALLAVVSVVVVAFLAWLAWAAWFHGNPAASSELVGFDVRDDHTVEVTVVVQLDGVEEADCLVRAFSEDHATVGELAFEATHGQQDVTVRTERLATSIEMVGCTVPGQPRRR